jgi:hypothetical protein
VEISPICSRRRKTKQKQKLLDPPVATTQGGCVAGEGGADGHSTIITPPPLVSTSLE